MQCLGYRDTTTIRVGFPEKVDTDLLDAVASYMKRKDLTKEVEIKKSKRPFLHSYQIQGGRLVVCVYNKRLTEEAIVGAIRMVLFQAKSKHTINTNDVLGDICRSFATAISPVTKKSNKGKDEKGVEGEGGDGETREARRKAVKIGLDGKPRPDKIKRIRKDIDETTELMKGNIMKLLDRGEKIDHLQTVSEDIEAASGSFAKKSNKLKCAKCKEVCKWRCVLIIVCIVLILVLGGGITLAVLKFAHSK